MPTTHPLIDIHTHLYPPTYLSLLSSRTEIPYLFHPSPTPTDASSTLPTTSPHPRLIILPTDAPPTLPPAQHGRPIDPSYSSVAQKLAFMSTHNIRTSVLSLANPWLDFLPAAEAALWAMKVNDEFEAICADSGGRLFAFGCLPVSASADEVCNEIRRLKTLPHIRGVILGTSGLGRGLDDAALDPMWAALERSRTLVFLHPHYGLPNEVFGPGVQEYGHVLPLSLGFPMETTVAFTRMLLSGVFDRFSDLKVLLAHAGGAVPFLAGRVQSCVLHERHFRDAVGNMVRKRRDVWDVLRKNVWLDAVTYGEVATRAAVEAVGRERMLFGTDHPFFPPLDDGAEEWLSVRTNVEAVEGALAGDEETIGMVLGGNAVRLLGLVETVK